MSQTGTIVGVTPEGAKLDVVKETLWQQEYDDVLAKLASAETDAGERAALLDRIDKVAIPIEAAKMQGEALLAVAGQVAKDFHAGLIDDAQVQQIMQAGHQALRDGLDDETAPELAVIADGQAELSAGVAEMRAMEAERGALAPSAEDAARQMDLMHPALDTTQAWIELVGDGRNALGDAARAMAEARGERPHADMDLLARQLDACDTLRASDEAMIDAHVEGVPMMHDLIDVASDAYRDGTIWPGLDEIYVEQVLQERIDEVRGDYGYPPLYPTIEPDQMEVAE